MIQNKVIYNKETCETIIEEIEIEDKIEEIIDEIPIEPSIEEKIENLQNVDTEHELAIVELANMIIEITGGV